MKTADISSLRMLRRARDPDSAKKFYTEQLG